jgi:transposase-like protein
MEEREMAKRRRKFSPQQKASILREHLIDKVAVSELCDKHGLQPTVFYRWQKEMIENLASLFERRGASETKALRNQVETLKEKLARKDAIIAEVMEDYVEAKKTLGER